MKKPKSNLFDKLFGRKLKPQTAKENTMEKKALYGIIKMLIDAYNAAVAKIASLESANRSLTMRVKDLEDAAAADFALDGEMGTAIQAILPAVGGSMGGVE